MVCAGILYLKYAEDIFCSLSTKEVGSIYWYDCNIEKYVYHVKYVRELRYLNMLRALFTRVFCALGAITLKRQSLVKVSRLTFEMEV